MTARTGRWDTRALILTATYLVVLFAVLVQGMTLKRLVQRIVGVTAATDCAARVQGSA